MFPLTTIPYHIDIKELINAISMPYGINANILVGYLKPVFGRMTEL